MSVPLIEMPCPWGGVNETGVKEASVRRTMAWTGEEMHLVDWRRLDVRSVCNTPVGWKWLRSGTARNDVACVEHKEGCYADASVGCKGRDTYSTELSGLGCRNAALVGVGVAGSVEWPHKSWQNQWRTFIKQQLRANCPSNNEEIFTALVQYYGRIIRKASFTAKTHTKLSNASGK